jgi:HD-GYP domain-containing protein (c-di-GMP phosphodiesterase class II)
MKLRRLRRRDLEVGMFLAKYGQGTPDNPFVSVGKPLLSLLNVDEFVPPEVDEVLVDDSLTLHMLNRLHRERLQEQAERPAPAVPLAEELPVAEKLYTEALDHAHEFMADARKGRDVDYHDAQPVVDGLIESVFRNESAAATMFKLRRFDEYSYTHCINVGVLAIILGKYLGQDKDTLRLLGLAGLFHDVGKARIPEDILNKPGELTTREMGIMKTHPLESYKIISNTPGPEQNILRGAIEHHERYDGTGYPRGLAGADIGIFGRIVSIVDVYDALTSKRCYRNAMPTYKALSLMYQWRDSSFAPNSIEHFIKCIGVYPAGSFVRLSSGEYAIVTEINMINASRPTVKILFDPWMRRKAAVAVDLLHDDGGLEIRECLNPAGYPVDLTTLLLA